MSNQSKFLALTEVYRQLGFEHSNNVPFNRHTVSSKPRFKGIRSMQNEKHISKSFDQDLDEAIRLFLHMGDSAANQVAKAIHALTDRDQTLAQEVIDMDFNINRMEVDLDEHILLLVAKRQPAASDLRLVMAISKGVVDLERIGDEAVKIAQMTIKIIAQGKTEYGYAEVQHLSNQVRLMVHNALEAFSQSNAEQAFEVMRNDKLVNDEYQSAIRALMTYIMEDSRYVSKVMNIMWVLRALERIGDHAQNVAELVINYISGQDVRHSDYAEVEKAVQEANDRMAARQASTTSDTDIDNDSEAIDKNED